MPEIPEPGTSSTNKCNATTGENTPPISGGTPKPNSSKGKKIRSNQRASGTNVSSARLDPPPRYLITDLNRLTFKRGETAYQADDTEHTSEWIAYISEFANLKPGIDWDDLEERAYFLNLLYVFCEQKATLFPFEENLTEKFNER